MSEITNDEIDTLKLLQAFCESEVTGAQQSVLRRNLRNALKKNHNNNSISYSRILEASGPERTALLSTHTRALQKNTRDKLRAAMDHDPDLTEDKLIAMYVTTLREVLKREPDDQELTKIPAFIEKDLRTLGPLKVAAEKLMNPEPPTAAGEIPYDDPEADFTLGKDVFMYDPEKKRWQAGPNTTAKPPPPPES